MKLLSSIFLAAGLLIANCSFAADENMTVTGSRIPPGSGGAGGGSGGSSGDKFFQTCTRAGDSRCGGGVTPTFLVKHACQECQSDSAFFKCEVHTATTFGEDPGKTMGKLEGQNCCAKQGGRVLTTKAGKC